MIKGSVNADLQAIITLSIAGKRWRALVDSGFTGDLELPIELQKPLRAEWVGLMHSSLAGGQSIIENLYEVEIVFDGKKVLAQTTFVPGKQALVGARLMRRHRLEIDYPARTVVIERRN